MLCYRFLIKRALGKEQRQQHRPLPLPIRPTPPHPLFSSSLSLPRSINLFALRPRHLTPLNVPTPPPCPLPPLAALQLRHPPSVCQFRVFKLVFAALSLSPATSLSLFPTPLLFISLSTHIFACRRVLISMARTHRRPSTRSPYTSLLFPPLYPFPFPLLLVLSLVIRNPSVFGQLCACARIRNERWRVRVRGPPSTSPSRLSSHYAYAALRRTYTCCRS